MIPLYSTSQIREIDSYAINSLKYPSIILMENAAKEISNEIIELLSTMENPSIGIVCGKGNNGGDGFAVARHLANESFNVTVIFFDEENKFSPDCNTNFQLLKNIAKENKKIKLLPYSVNNLRKVKSCNVLIDALLGSGSTGKLKEPYPQIINYLNTLNAFKIAIDIPTGLDADKGTGEVVFNSDLIITLAGFKPGLFIEKGYASTQQVICKNIGIDPAYLNKYTTKNYLIEPDDVINLIPEKRKNLNKYSNGKVFTIAGSVEYPGAASITSAAVFYTGAGASVLAFPKSGRELLNSIIPEVVVKTYNDNNTGCLSIEALNSVKKWSDWADVVALGPGIGREAASVEAVRQFLKNNKNKKIILDADAIFAISGNEYKNYNLKNVILTPHHKEFSSLIGTNLDTLEEDIFTYGKNFVKETGAFLVLKGAPTIIFTPVGECFINTAGNQGMAKFGSGDALTGVIAGFLAQSGKIKDSIIAGVYLHSFSADILAAKLQHYGFTATDIIANLHFTFQFLRKSIA